MRIILKVLIASLLLFVCVGSYGHEGCVNISTGHPVCAPPNGGIAKDSFGQVVCGDGQCVINDIGQVACSNQSGGFATIDSVGKIVCTGGCSQGSQNKCEIPR